jgi:hypothetical protein
VAACVAWLEALVLGLYGLSLIPVINGHRVTMSITAITFLTVYAGFLAYCAWRLWLLHLWARSPVVLAQLIQIPVGLSFWGGATSAVTVAALLLSGIALIGVFHPQSLAALEHAEG